jgi:hypothetical protein
MNLFPLDSDLTKCAEYTVDSHCIKQILESGQILSNCYPQEFALYKHTHKNHPMSLWVQESLSNFNWAINYGLALSAEYTFRYNKIHKCHKVLEYYQHFQPKIKDIGPTRMPRCFGELKGKIPETDDVVNDYRIYYKLAKYHLFSWKNRQVPNWVLE